MDDGMYKEERKKHLCNFARRPAVRNVVRQTMDSFLNNETSRVDVPLLQLGGGGGEDV